MVGLKGKLAWAAVSEDGRVSISFINYSRREVVEMLKDEEKQFGATHLKPHRVLIIPVDFGQT